MIWRIPVPQRLRLFLWLVYKEKLLTHLERHKRFITQISFCPYCNDTYESMLHILRDFPRTKALWNQLLNATKATSSDGINDVLFKNVEPSLEAVYHRAIIWVRYYHTCSSSTNTSPHTMDFLKWKRHKLGWICLNVDGTVSASMGFGSVGSLLRDNTGRWLLGFNRTIGIMDSFHAKLSGI
ncbi:hypothetical protein F3Y22_tig00112261pilonHSYRG00208 [Hibiscus syriacus]|uniref:Reverse transcriptase zinc-binding domain-containing protein n=1 Tax=Hibiscus syriacus TaxID=106335 RepID=A0A6A2XGY7_HIBSY|nr:hypothetical protein F3Y22_tig00112261pilonHSYRG00208 [Hibiscus syriacus]